MYGERRPGTFGLKTAFFNQATNYPVITAASSNACGIVVVGPGVAGSNTSNTYGVLVDGTTTFVPSSGSSSGTTAPTLYAGPMWNSTTNIN